MSAMCRLFSWFKTPHKNISIFFSKYIDTCIQKSLLYIHVCIINRELVLRKTKEDAEKTRQDIINAGISVFSRKWFAIVNMCDIAREAGVTRGAIYWHFKNKAELFIEIHNLVVKEIEIIINDSIAQGITLKERTFSILKNIIMKYYNDKNLRQMSRVLYLNQAVLEMPEFREWHLNYHQEKGHFFSELYQKAVGVSIDLKNDENAHIEFLSVVAYVQGLLDMIIFKEETSLKKLDEKKISQLVNIFLDGLFNYLPNKSA